MPLPTAMSVLGEIRGRYVRPCRAPRRRRTVRVTAARSPESVAGCHRWRTRRGDVYEVGGPPGPADPPSRPAARASGRLAAEHGTLRKTARPRPAPAPVPGDRWLERPSGVGQEGRCRRKASELDPDRRVCGQRGVPAGHGSTPPAHPVRPGTDFCRRRAMSGLSELTELTVSAAEFQN